MVESRLIEIEKETDDKFIGFKQTNEILKLIVYDIEKITHKMISESRENIVLSAVKCAILKDTEKDSPL